MNLLKSAFRLNFLAAGLFLVNAIVAIYNEHEDYWKYLVLALLFVFLGLFYRKKLKKQEKNA
jgi:membrane protein DedA with SNARE-associated domain